jgi:hypothetical protein
MSIGAGIAIAGVWICTAFITRDKTVTGFGMVLTLISAVIATAYIAAVR